MKLFSFLVVGVPAISHALSSAPDVSAQELPSELGFLEPDNVERASGQYGMATLGPVTGIFELQTGINNGVERKAQATPTPTSTSSSSDYDYSYAVELSGFDGSITHYYVSYSDPYVSGAVGVGHANPTPTPVLVPVAPSPKCDASSSGLLSVLGLDLGLRLNLALLGIDLCVAL